LAQVDGVDAVARAAMDDAVDLLRPGEDSAGAVAQDGVVLPASLPQLVDYLHIFLGDLVAQVMGALPLEAGALGGAVEIAGDDVPADAALGQVVERRHAAGGRIGGRVGGGGGGGGGRRLGDAGAGPPRQTRADRRQR